jgi:hypothetical protein
MSLSISKGKKMCQFFCGKINDTNKLTQKLCQFLKRGKNATSFEINVTRITRHIKEFILMPNEKLLKVFFKKKGDGSPSPKISVDKNATPYSSF